ncbi:MAG TPA: hypothetical protein VG733_03395 [Chthoniobacteraceae bacterium]|nr:hypothetical protein [Chthoniobacteraceae bacterium]
MSTLRKYAVALLAAAGIWLLSAPASFAGGPFHPAPARQYRPYYPRHYSFYSPSWYYYHRPHYYYGSPARRRGD